MRRSCMMAPAAMDCFDDTFPIDPDASAESLRTSVARRSFASCAATSSRVKGGSQEDVVGHCLDEFTASPTMTKQGRNAGRYGHR